ncbi:uncharacterized protein RHO25_010664 [Cercospora beticola]|nr:hypothetical protein RHO25_010664 [Cercospora beticola]
MASSASTSAPLTHPAASLPGLPPELSSMVLKHVFPRTAPLKVIKFGDKFRMLTRQGHGLQPGLLALSKGFLWEGAPWLYGSNTISIATQHVSEFLQSIGEANKKLVRQLMVSPDSHLPWALREMARCPKLGNIQLTAGIVAPERLVCMLLPAAIKMRKTYQKNLIERLSFVPDPSYALSVALDDEEWQDDIEEETETYAEKVLEDLRDRLARKGYSVAG